MHFDVKLVCRLFYRVSLRDAGAAGDGFRLSEYFGETGAAVAGYARRRFWTSAISPPIRSGTPPIRSISWNSVFRRRWGRRRSAPSPRPTQVVGVGTALAGLYLVSRFIGMLRGAVKAQPRPKPFWRKFF